MSRKKTENPDETTTLSEDTLEKVSGGAIVRSGNTVAAVAGAAAPFLVSRSICLSKRVRRCFRKAACRETNLPKSISTCTAIQISERKSDRNQRKEEAKMSKENLEQFMNQVTASEELQARIGDEIDAETLIALGADGVQSGFAEIGRLVLQRTMLRVGLKADIC